MKRLLVLALFPFHVFSQSADTAVIRKHMVFLTSTPEPRNYEHVEQLQEVAAYIHNEFAKYADTVTFQPFKIGERLYTNVIASFGSQHSKRLIIGAHYDVCGDQPGADDNATGITGLLELARMLQGKQLSKRIDLVAYTLEEPPFYASEYMGSLLHAKEMKETGVDVEGMICLEMIGYFSDEKGSQDYPIKAMRMIYGKTGDYITVVNKTSPGKFARSFTKKFKHVSRVKAKEFRAPRSITGVDFSDHRSYWSQGYSAVMITDTAFYRNNNYHEAGDTLDKLDLYRMSQVIDAVFLSLEVD